MRIRTLAPLGLAVGLFLHGVLHGAAAVAATAPASVLDDPLFVAQLEQGLDRLYDLDFAGASARFAEIGRRYPDHPVKPVLAMLPTWWAILLDPEETSHDAAMTAALEETLARSEARLRQDKKDHDGRLFKATALAFRGRLRALRGKWIPAAFDGRGALRLVRRLAEEDRRSPDLDFGLGLYDYFAEVVPERYPALKPLTPFFPSGDRVRGLERLAEVARHGHFAQSEAAYYLLEIHFILEKDAAKSQEYAERLHRRHPNNALYHVYAGRVAARFGRCKEAETTLREVLARHAARRPGYTDHQAAAALYWLARCETDGGRYAEALRELERLTALTRSRPGSPLNTLGQLQQGMSLDALGQRDAAEACYRRVLELEDTGGAHDLAKRYLDVPYRGAAGRRS